MKKILLLIISVLFIFFPADARYSIDKKKYDYRIFKYQPGDRYNPTMVGISSLIIPGLDQLITGEPIRGVAFLGVSLGCWVIAGSSNNTGSYGSAMARLTFGLAGVVSLWVWSVADAQRIVKVRNLAWRDKKKSSVRLQIQPCISQTKSVDSEKITVGISMKITLP